LKALKTVVIRLFGRLPTLHDSRHSHRDGTVRHVAKHGGIGADHDIPNWTEKFRTGSDIHIVADARRQLFVQPTQPDHDAVANSAGIA
jgi:hypothetical protein